ncbi:2-hydroxyisoflavanone synthase [Trifolium repens]|nr:2-hydroxyisoflavanone synthase [Trifolium repens]
MDFIGPLKIFKKFGNYEQRIDAIFNKYDPIIEKVIKKRQEIVNKRRSGEIQDGEEESVVFLDTLLEYAQDETMEIKITKEQIKGLVVDFFSAGTDSTAVATEWTLAELLNNPRVLKKAREEIESVVGKDRLVDESDVQNLPYIRAVVKEAFRLHPPLPVVKRKCTQECEINGRMCPGANLATAGMATLLASIIQCFDLRVPGAHGQILHGDDAKVSMEERPGLTVPRAHNLMCVPLARAGVAAKLISS